ncbi:MAG: TonB-dependent receptor [Acidobacteria bacterium]|nr:TonB-dependent receptor [Acidobacteriota bacterium]
MGNLRKPCLLFVLLSLCSAFLAAQVPTGAIDGRVQDETAAVIPGATVIVRHRDTGVQRVLTTAADGTFSAPLLAAGEYEVRVEAKGFRSLLRQATVETGSTTTAIMEMQVGSTTEVVTVEAAAAQISYDSHKIDGVVTRKQIQELPLNGRSFLQLAFLEPGVTVSTETLAQRNAQFGVSVLGAPTAFTAITVDGGNSRNSIEGGTQQNFSQEVVQEFQISSVNMDLSTGLGGVGAVNIVTRSGGNDYHGSGYFFFRDHNMAAYPNLRRIAISPDPFFARRQSGFWVGGPMVKNRAFFFVNLEHNNQDSVITVTPNSPFFQSMAGNYTSPYTATQYSPRFDFRINNNHTLFLRYSHDGNRGFGPNGGAPLPSNWLRNTNWADQSLLGLTSTFSSSVVNDFRFVYNYWQNRNLFPRPEDCPGCVGLAFPQVNFIDSNLLMGNTSNATQGRDLRKFNINDNVTWQKGTHRVKFGAQLERAPGTGFWGFADPAVAYVWGPDILFQVGGQGLLNLYGLPGQFTKNEDIQKLPIYLFVMGIGDPGQPPPYNINIAKWNNRYNFYVQDSWRIRSNFTLNYGLAYLFESTVANHDLDKPAYLKPLLGADGIQPTAKDTNNISPSIGFAWNVGKDNKTVIRGGAGLYYDTRVLWQRLRERAVVGPLGNGRAQVPGSAVANRPEFGIAGLPAGVPLEFRTGPTPFRLGDLQRILPAIRAEAERALARPSFDLSIRGIDVAKTGVDLMPHNYPTPYSTHFNIGVQREIMRNMVVSADFVNRQFIHLLFGGVDYNRFQRVQGPVIPRCTAAQAGNPAAQCSVGPITFFDPADRNRYRALLVKVDKRFSRRFQFTASYARTYQAGANGIVNLDNWFQSYGPQGARNILNVSGIVELPWKVQLSFISSHGSKGPFMPFIPSVDLDGDGSDSEPLPGARFNGFNRGLGKDDLTKLVDQFNQQWAGKRTSRGQLVPRITVPQSYEFGEGFHSQDLRLTKFFDFKERYRISVFAEMFNVLNVANLGGFSNNLTNPAAFGQPTSRANQCLDPAARERCSWAPASLSSRWRGTQRRWRGTQRRLKAGGGQEWPPHTLNPRGPSRLCPPARPPRGVAHRY